MVDRTKPRLATLRADVPWRVYDAIVRKSCLHVDAWFYQMPDDELYFVLRVARAGHEVLAVSTFHASAAGLVPVANIADIERTGMARHIDSAWGRKYAPWANGLHHTQIMPIIHQPVTGYKGHRSIRLHYVWTDAKLDDPMQGIENLYGFTGRQGRDDRYGRTKEGVRAAATSPWSAADRSMLRTLQKLLN